MIEAKKILGGMNMERLDARLILGHALGRDDGVLPHEVIEFDAAAQARLNGFLARRMAGEPVSRIRGRREFYGLDFEITPATLDPRPDSEIVVEAAIGWLRECGVDSPNVLDLGTGSGCLLLSVLHNVPEARGIGVDVSDEAVGVARRNAINLGLESRVDFVVGNWDDGLDGVFDCVIANPPYIRSDDIPALMADVREYDPHLALDGSADGLGAFREIIPRIAVRLAPDGCGIVENGTGQGGEICAMIRKAGLVPIGILPDLAGVDRAISFQKKSGKSKNNA